MGGSGEGSCTAVTSVLVFFGVRGCLICRSGSLPIRNKPRYSGPMFWSRERHCGFSPSMHGKHVAVTLPSRCHWGGCWKQQFRYSRLGCATAIRSPASEGNVGLDPEVLRAEQINLECCRNIAVQLLRIRIGFAMTYRGVGLKIPRAPDWTVWADG